MIALYISLVAGALNSLLFLYFVSAYMQLRVVFFESGAAIPLYTYVGPLVVLILAAVSFVFAVFVRQRNKEGKTIRYQTAVSILLLLSPFIWLIVHWFILSLSLYNLTPGSLR